MDIDEKSRTILSEKSLLKLYNFDRIEDFQGIRIICNYDHGNTCYKISMFGQGFYFNPREFVKIANSSGTGDLFDAFAEIGRDQIFETISDNNSYFIFRRALQEAQREECRLFLDISPSDNKAECKVLKFAPCKKSKKKRNNL